MKAKITSKKNYPAAVRKDCVSALKGLGKGVWQALGGADNYIKQERVTWEK